MTELSPRPNEEYLSLFTDPNTKRRVLLLELTFEEPHAKVILSSNPATLPDVRLDVIQPDPLRSNTPYIKATRSFLSEIFDPNDGNHAPSVTSTFEFLSNIKLS